MGVSSIGGIGGSQQPYATPLSSGPAAAQRSTTPVETAQEDEAERIRQTQNSASSSATPTRGQNLNITV